MDAPLPPLTDLACRWAHRGTISARGLPALQALALMKRAQGSTVSVGIPALNEEKTIGRICRIINSELVEASLVDELVVIDGTSSDETVVRARAAGADIVDVSSLPPDIPPVRGKGESLWRSLGVLSGDIVVWVDADIANFRSHFVTRLVAPLLMHPSIGFVKAFYERPLAVDGALFPSGGGRATELLARPLLALLFPELGGFRQPLAGEYAGRREVFEGVPFFTGYSVEVGLLIDLLGTIGLDRMAQVDLGVRMHRNRPLTELSRMAHGIARSVLRRAEELGRLSATIDYLTHPLLQQESRGSMAVERSMELERPPMAMMTGYPLTFGERRGSTFAPRGIVEAR